MYKGDHLLNVFNIVAGLASIVSVVLAVYNFDKEPRQLIVYWTIAVIVAASWVVTLLAGLRLARLRKEQIRVMTATQESHAARVERIANEQRREISRMQSDHRDDLAKTRRDFEKKLNAGRVRMEREARYSKAQGNFHKCIHNLRDAWFSLETGDSKETVIRQLNNSIGAFAEAFSLITGQHCWAIVKELTFIPPADESLIDPDSGQSDLGKQFLFVKTLFESEETVGRQGPSKTDRLYANTELGKLFDEWTRACWCSNDLDALFAKGEYRNNEWRGVPGNGDGNFNATFAWPIRKRLYSETPTLAPLNVKQDIIGFLCVRTMAKHVFREAADRDMGAAYADAFYIVLKRLKSRA